MGLPDEFVNSYTKEIQGSTIFGQKLEDLTREELMAVACAGWQAKERDKCKRCLLKKF